MREQVKKPYPQDVQNYKTWEAGDEEDEES